MRHRTYQTYATRRYRAERNAMLGYAALALLTVAGSFAAAALGIYLHSGHVCF